MDITGFRRGELEQINKKLEQVSQNKNQDNFVAVKKTTDTEKPLDASEIDKLRKRKAELEQLLGLSRQTPMDGAFNK